jgi:hypothetical protein
LDGLANPSKKDSRRPSSRQDSSPGTRITPPLAGTVIPPMVTFCTGSTTFTS